jgi:hypothetical protein
MNATHVNLIDLVNTLETITLFESELALAEYTNRTKNTFHWEMHISKTHTHEKALKRGVVEGDSLSEDEGWCNFESG